MKNKLILAFFLIVSFGAGLTAQSEQGMSFAEAQIRLEEHFGVKI